MCKIVWPLLCSWVLLIGAQAVASPDVQPPPSQQEILAVEEKEQVLSPTSPEADSPEADAPQTEDPSAQVVPTPTPGVVLEDSQIEATTRRVKEAYMNQDYLLLAALVLLLIIWAARRSSWVEHHVPSKYWPGVAAVGSLVGMVAYGVVQTPEGMAINWWKIVTEALLISTSSGGLFSLGRTFKRDPASAT